MKSGLRPREGRKFSPAAGLEPRRRGIRVRLLTLFQEIGDDIVAVGLFLEALEGHFRALEEFLRLGEKGVQRIVGPGASKSRQAGGIVEVGVAGLGPTDHENLDRGKPLSGFLDD